MITLIEKDGSTIAVFSKVTQKEAELLGQIKEASQTEEVSQTVTPKPASKPAFNFGGGITSIQPANGNDYFATAPKSLTAGDTLKHSDRSVPMEL